MSKNRWLLLGLLLLMTACVVVVVLAYVLPPRPGVTKENFDRIEVGMTRAEVEKIFGVENLPGRNPLRRLSRQLFEDEDTDALADIHFDETDRVALAEWRPGRPDERTPLDKLLQRLHLREKPQRLQIEFTTMN